MKLTERQTALADEILEAVETSEEWEEIQTKDPYIRMCKEALGRVLDTLIGVLELDCYSELEDSIGGYCDSIMSAAIRYGVKVGSTMQAAIENPMLISQHIADRVAERANTTQPPG